MTPSPLPRPAVALESLSLRSPAALVSAIPYLLGFVPEQSVVLVWLGAGRIVLTQRLDLPDGPTAPPAWTTAAWDHPAAAVADEVIAVIASAHAPAPTLVQQMRHAAAERGLGLRDLLRMDDGRWWSLLCPDRTCCPPEGRPVDPDVAGLVAAEFTVHGRAPLGSRAEVAATMAADPEAVARLRPVLDASAARERGRRAGWPSEMWRDRALAAVTRLLTAEGRADDDDLAVALIGLQDIRVRDTALWDLVHLEAEALRHALAALVDALRRAPEGFVAPLGTLAAVAAWLDGDGTRAGVALDRALADDPGYRLGRLVHAAVAAGMPPSAWREAMGSLTREDCRHGTGHAEPD